MNLESTTLPTSARKRAIRELSENLAPEREKWVGRNAFFHDEDIRYMRFLIPEGLRVLDMGCGTGRLLAALKPSKGVGVDFSNGMIEIARTQYPELEFHVGDVEDIACIAPLEGPFDVIIMSDTVGSLDDCEETFANLHRLCTRETRVVIAYYSRMWEPVLNVAEKLGLMMPHLQQNWLSTEDIGNLLRLADFEVVKREWRQLMPKKMLGLGGLINRYIAPIAIIRRACLRNYVVARPVRNRVMGSMSTTVLIPCRNERGNIEAAVQRLPKFCDDMEIIYVEGHSKDGTLDEIHRVIAKYPDKDIKVFVQDGKGKGDAVRKGFANARGDILMILDADLTVSPEALPKFYRALVTGKGEFINGTRLVYPMEDQAMRFLNLLANQVFAWLFSWLLNQRFTDTLCGTKVLTRRHYEQIVANRNYFGEFDPFGDFDLIFGATKMNLKVTEVPIAYASRTYGETQISRFRHGLLLLRMVVFAFRKLKAF
ncbi:MAG TPA: glycosyltransferase [Sulfuricella sp.]|nr:glycosyltransferase [Sulfuricella sp.]